MAGTSKDKAGRGRDATSSTATSPEERAAQRRREIQRLRRRRFLAYGLIALGVLVAGSHLLEHLDVIQVLDNKALQDLLIGYPTGGLLVVLGLVLLPADKY